MGGTILWALLTGAISGGAWVAIVLLRRQQRQVVRHTELSEDLERRLAQLGEVDQRLRDVEERLDFAERLLIRDQAENRPLPPNG